MTLQEKIAQVTTGKPKVTAAERTELDAMIAAIEKEISAGTVALADANAAWRAARQKAADAKKARGVLLARCGAMRQLLTDPARPAAQVAKT